MSTAPDVARIRTIKPSIWADQRFTRLSMEARLTALGLISFADDCGRFIASPQAIAGAVFPYDEVGRAMLKWRDEVAEVGLIELYEVDGRAYGWFPHWLKHQRINRPQPSSLPPSPNDSVSPDVSGSGTEGREERGERKGERNAREHTIPDDFELTPDLLAAAVRSGLTEQAAKPEFDHFAAWHRSHGTKHIRWDQAWRVWLSKGAKRRAEQAGQSDGPPEPEWGR